MRMYLNFLLVSHHSQTDEKNGIGSATVSLEMSPTRTSTSAALIEEVI